MCETSRPATFTRIGRNTCPPGFEVQQRGYLYSNIYNKKKGEFVCINIDRETYGSRSSSNDNAGRLYRVETQCGSLPCPPFTEDREIVCTVCSALDISETCPYYRYGKFCLQACPKYCYSAENRTCHQCHDQCLDGCTGSSNRDCIGQCRMFTYRAADWQTGKYACVEVCPNNTYPLEDKECLPEPG